jgi:hypothetical protein
VQPPPDAVDAILLWLRGHDTMLVGLAATSVVLFVATLVAVPFVVVRLPEDHFQPPRRRRLRSAAPRPILRTAWRVGKNALGAVLVLAGLIMLVLPGQGLLTIVVGLVLLDFPGKYRFERWLIGRKRVLASLNWLRRRAGKPPLLPPPRRGSQPSSTASRSPPNTS